MRAFVPSYQMISPATLVEALEVLSQPGNKWKAFAGGTDLMVLLESGKLLHKHYVNVWQLPELRGIEVTADWIRAGALTTYSEVQNHPVMQREFPMLCQAAKETGGIAIQNRGTLGGNIVNASPAADSPPALLAYDAELELVSKSGARTVPYSRFHVGYKRMDLQPDELVRAIRLRRTTNHLTHYYRKVGTRKAQAISKTCFAAVGQLKDGAISLVRIAMGSVAPVPLRCFAVEEKLLHQPLREQTVEAAVEALSREISPIDDLRSTRRYRLQVSLNLLRDFLARLANG